jgi:hypothetical protein
VVAQNYLPQALALCGSIREIEPDRNFVILVIDGDRQDLESGRPKLRMASTRVLGLPKNEVQDLATIYDVVEFSTAVKPLFLKYLLGHYEQAVYLDPDTFLLSPLLELESLVDESGVVMTPHFLVAIRPDESYISEVHSLTVGVHNLGFCAVGRNGVEFLDWWWSHLERECLIYPLLGLFVDQKWTDVGATLFKAHSLRHYGYNVGPWNLHERTLAAAPTGFVVNQTGEPLRLFHFSGFNPHKPDEISERLNISLKDARVGNQVLSELSRRYAERVLEAREVLGEISEYGFARDALGRKLTKRIRRAYRKDLITRGKDHNLPSPFDIDEAKAFGRWKRRTWSSRVGLTAGDAAIAIKYAFPDEYNTLRRSLPHQFAWLRSRLLTASRVRR